MPRWWISCASGWASWLFVGTLSAQSLDPNLSPVPTDAANPPPESAPQATTPPFDVDVVLVGTAGASDALVRTMADLLGTHRITPRFRLQPALTQQDLLGSQRRLGGGSVTVWITVPSPNASLLVFANPLFERFLVREIPLPGGLDEFGRESIAQVVESSSVALVEGEAGMSRSEVQSALGKNLMPAAPVPTPRPAARSRVPSPERRATGASSRTPRARLGAAYALGWSGPDLGLTHGPGVLLGLELEGRRDSLLVMAALEWHFEQRYRSAVVDLRVQSTTAWLLFGWRRPVPGSTSLLGALGPGLHSTRVDAEAVQDSAARPEPGSTRLTPWLRALAAVEWGDSPVLLQLLGSCDLSLSRSRYELEGPSGRAPLFAPWSVRPGIALGMSWR